MFEIILLEFSFDFAMFSVTSVTHRKRRMREKVQELQISHMSDVNWEEKIKNKITLNFQLTFRCLLGFTL